VEKYHSYKATQHLFENIYHKIWYGKEVNLIDFYHPLIQDSYTNSYEKVKHPLKENKLPANWKESLEEYV
jgi:hypothetical protein